MEPRHPAEAFEQLSPETLELALAGELYAFRASDGARLPKIDSTTDETWAQTWAESVIFYLDATAHDKNGVQMSHDRGAYGVYDFVADRWIGDLPWTPDQNERVWALVQQHPRFAEIDSLPEAAGWGKQALR